MRARYLAWSALSAVLFLSGQAAADIPADLRLRSFPTMTPSSLLMRTAQAEDVPPASSTTIAPLDPEVGEDALVLEIEAQLKERLTASDALGQRRRLDEKVVLQVSLGVGLDGGQPSGETLASGQVLDERTDYARLRSYGFGDLVIGTNGLGLRNVQSYLATGYRFTQQIEQNSKAIPSVYDGAFGNFVVRSAWIDVDDVFDTPALKPLHLRVGRQTKYAAAIAHFTGLTVGYHTKAVRGSLFTGSRAQLYEPNPDGSDLINGADLTVDLYELRRIPLVLTASALRFDRKNHLDGSAALRFGRNALLRGRVRAFDGEIAQENLRLRARLTAVTTVSAELDNRHSSDWIYDMLLATQPTEQGRTDPRSYLNLGLPRARLRGAARAGTVLLRNIDLLASVAAALEYADESEFAPTATRSSYVEAGSAVEVRVRRGVRLGISGTGRVYRRPVGETPMQTTDADPLPENTAGIGETAFVEGGASLRYSLGARVFSASAEFYGRAFRFQTPYSDEPSPVGDFRSGGRFVIDGWATKQVRVRFNYDLSLGAIRYAPELAGVKSLRATIEGTF